MKKSILIFATLICGTAFAQKEFAPFGATWYYSKVENFAGEEGYIKIISERDTVINNKQSKILSQIYYSSNGDRSVLNNFYIHQAGDTVYYWIDDSFQILYNFSLKKGDTMMIYSKDILCPDNESHLGEIKVDSVVNILINGIELKKFYTSPTEGSVYKYSGPFIEVIGGIDGIYPVDTGCSADAFPDIGKLRCYYDSSLGHFNVPDRVSCDSLLTTSIIETINNLDVNIFYWHERKSFNVDLTNLNLHGKFIIKVYDIQGREISI
ncbi:MAG TPA: hypothetical protein VE912_21580, partial [Bacteroidales bacterium]|nr:hypothetical protein [Bacteroidales bacterium]